MKLESVENKSSTSVAVKADYLIQKMYRHILHDKCEHCKRILSDNKEDNDKGPARPPSKPAPAEGATHPHHNLGQSGFGVLQNV